MKYEDFVLPIIKRNTSTNAHLIKNFDNGEVIPDTKCMRIECYENRWKHPDKGALVLCKEHSAEVIRGEAKAPPIRHCIDYQSSARKLFIIEE